MEPLSQAQLPTAGLPIPGLTQYVLDSNLLLA